MKPRSERKNNEHIHGNTRKPYQRFKVNDIIDDIHALARPPPAKRRKLSDAAPVKASNKDNEQTKENNSKETVQLKQENKVAAEVKSIGKKISK